MKKLLEKDGFYLSLFVCVCFVAVGGIIFTKNNVDKLANESIANKSEEEIHLIEKEEENEDAIPTSTDSDQNLSSAKQNEASKLNYVGNEVIREFSETQPSYSETLEVWEIHKGIDVSTKSGQDIKSLLEGTVEDIYNDDKLGKTIKIKSTDNKVVLYSNLADTTKVEKGDKVAEGQVIGTSGNTAICEIKEEPHVHIELFEGEKSLDPMTIIK